MNKPLFLPLFALGGIVLALGLLTAPAQADTLQQNCGFTIPCPTDTPGSGGGGGGGGGTNPTETPVVPEPTMPPSQPSNTPFPTPAGGYLPTAEACSLAPTVTSFASNLNVRLGPGTDYDPIAIMVYFETRPIVGRYEFGDWWQIQLGDGALGWVKDSVVLVNGNTSIIPLVPAPNINGGAPTPGPLWQPTANPLCTPVPTATATNTPAAVATVATGATSGSEPTATTAATATMPAATSPSASTDSEEEVAAAPVATATDAPPTATSAPTITPAPVPGEEPDAGRSGNNMVLLGGAILVGLGALGFFMIGRRRSAAE